VCAANEFNKCGHKRSTSLRWTAKALYLVFKSIISSMYASLAGSSASFVGLITTLFFNGIPAKEVIPAIGGALIVFVISLVASFFLAFFIGSPIYDVLRKYNFSNYVTSSLLGCTFSFLIFPPTSTNLYFIAWLVVGVITGSIYHYTYTKRGSI
jgi:hypothetical protein